MRYVHQAIAAGVFVLLAAAINSQNAIAAGITIPAGTVIPVRMTDSIDSQQNHMGQEFRGVLDAPIHGHKQTVLPKGTLVYVRLVDVRSAGKLKGHSALTLQLDRIVTHDTTYTVHSNAIAMRGPSQGKKTGKSAGVGAIVGGGVGALFGGGTGALIGAGAGAGTGVATQALKETKPVRVESESLLSFRLSAPVHVAG